MPISVSCPSCQSQFRVSEQHLGKQGKCPHCQQRFTIGNNALAPPPPPPPQDNSAIPPSPPASTIPQTDVPQPSRLQSVGASFNNQFTKGQRGATVATVLVSLIVGYFAGREHLKYEVRSAFDTAKDRFTEGIKNIAAPVADGHSTLATETADEAERAPIEFGTACQTDRLKISILEADVRKIDVENLGSVSQSKEPQLAITLRIENHDDRKIMTYTANEFLGTNFLLRDDVDNVIRGVSFGFAADIVGALKSGYDIAPGMSADHLEVFATPPPKTKYLLLRVDLSAFGDSGQVTFRIPANQIKGFPS